MKPNVGGVDRILRIVAGIGVLSLLFILPGDAKWWGLIGIVPLATAVFNFCPAYTLFGISTAKK
ncbi:MAG: DUF2892 domain-containing protein [Desulfosudis oleivorans]|nr:DUF2892 domain-containing protein [Desulfosudis oleivorans]